MKVAVVACVVLAIACWKLSTIFREYSWVDRIWSLAPPAYAVWFAASAPAPGARAWIMAGLAVLWGVRLTHNYARKGGYAPGGEDYRWEVIRGRMPGWAFEVFNVVFICAFQNALLLGLAVPVWVVGRGGAPVGWADAALTAAFLAFLAGETVADAQQWRFHRAKAARQARGERVDPPFLTTGLFRYSRHPNFFCEMAMWWTVYGFTVAAGAPWLNAGLAGVVVLTLLFQGSTRLTEDISRSKYPSYAAYQRTTSRLVPLPPRRGGSRSLARV